MDRSISSFTWHNTDATGGPYRNTLHASCEHRLGASFSGVADWLLLRIISTHSLCRWPYPAGDTGIILTQSRAANWFLPVQGRGRGVRLTPGIRHVDFLRQKKAKREFVKFPGLSMRMNRTGELANRGGPYA